MKITQVKVCGISNPVGFDFRAVKVSWKVEEFSSPTQKYAKVEIAADPAFKEIVSVKEGADLQSFCEVMDMQQEPRTRYYVRITVTADNGETAVSDTAFFETAKQGETWTGQWIGPREEDEFHPVFKKRFTADKEVRSARIYICGLGLYEASLNGMQIGDEYLAPFYNDYDYDVQYQTYDITQMISSENEIAVMLGNGWYKGRFGLPGQQGKVGIYGHRFALIAEIHITYADGTTRVIGTDDSWTYEGSDVADSGIYDGEILDRTLWEGKDNSPRNAVFYDPEKKLSARFSMPLGVNETLPVREVIHTPKGETVLDFGQNFVGFVQLAADFSKGTKVSMDFGEVLNQGNFYNENYRTAKANFTYISGGRAETARPHFTFFGGRYVRIEGWPGTDEQLSKAVIGCVVYSRLDRTGYIETSDPKVNRLAANCLWSQKGNFLDVPTDCPQRDERFGWTGDANVFAVTATYNMDTRAFYEKYMYDLRIAQNQMGGSGPAVAPISGMEMQGGCVWGDVVTFLPSAMYDFFGDREMLAHHYPMMKDWVDFITRESEKNGNHHLFDFGFHFADWLAQDGMTEDSAIGGTDSYYLASCYYYASTRMVERAAKICGFTEDEKQYGALAEMIRQAIFNEYFSPSGRLCIDTQTAYLVALKFGLYLDRDKMIAALRDRLHKDAYRIRGGFIGATMLCQVLAENGFEREAIRYLLNEDYPGWLNCVNQGATTIWERWNMISDMGSGGYQMHSLNHYAYGSVIEYVYRYLGGIRSTETAFRSVDFRPQITGHFRYLNTSYDSVSGKYVCNWRIEEDGTVCVHVEVPFNCTATLALPNSGQEEKQLAAGSYDFSYSPERDFRLRFDDESLCMDYAKCPEAMEILKEQAPGIYAEITRGNLEMLAEPLSPFVMFQGLDPKIAAAKEAINQLRYS